MTSTIRLLDLFCGMGGLSYGFAEKGFDIVGVDIEKRAGLTFSYNSLGDFILMDITKSEVPGEYDVIVGGPPCEPWSCLNLTRRGRDHPRYGCLTAFFREVMSHMPIVFILENVPSIQKDPAFNRGLDEIKRHYDVVIYTIKYSEYGAAFARRRVFAVGTRLEAEMRPSKIMDSIRRERPSTVKQEICYLRNREQDATIDHVWPNLRTIERYRDYYETGKYGWYILEWDDVSPSFGNVMKTYILHPDSFKNGNDARPISVREALGIVGFPDEFRFPPGIGLTMKYEMVSDAVSPIFSMKLGEAVRNCVLRLWQS